MPEPPAAQRYLFESSLPAGSVEMASPGGARRGVTIWFIAAGSLVIGILIGFASGYTAGRRAEALLAIPPAFDTAERPVPTTDRENTYTEGMVSEPVRVDPEPIVAAPEPPAAAEPPAQEPPRNPGRQPAVAPRQAERAAPAPSSSPGRGSLQILSRPAGAEVTLDGRAIGRTPLVVSDVPAGRHDVRLELGGFRSWATSVRVESTSRTRVAASLEQ